MTSTLRQSAECVADHARARGLRIEQIDPVLCEDGCAVMFYAYASDDCLTAVAAIPMRLDNEKAFLHEEWRDAFTALLPADVIAKADAA